MKKDSKKEENKPQDPKKFKCRDNPPPVSVLDEAHKKGRVSSKPVDKSPRRYSF